MQDCHISSAVAMKIQLNAIITQLRISWYYIQHCNGSCGTYLRYWTSKRHPIHHPHRRAMGCLLWGFEKKNWPRYNSTALYHSPVLSHWCNWHIFKQFYFHLLHTKPIYMIYVSCINHSNIKKDVIILYALELRNLECSFQQDLVTYFTNNSFIHFTIRWWADTKQI